MKASTQLKAAAFALALPLSAQATVVEVQTVMGNFEVNLFDQQTPETVENFLGYVNSGAYFNNIVHRSMPNFVVQAGGYQINSDDEIQDVVTSASVVNEPVLSNVRGTLAMAKKAGDANSATSQWFVNLKDNSANLDLSNGGYTVFGQVLGDGMDVVDALAALPTFPLCADCAFENVPLRDYGQDEIDAEIPVGLEHFVLITDIVVTDAGTNTHPELNPKENTLIDQVDNGGDQDSGSSGGGSTGWLALLALGLAGLRRKWQK